MVKRVSNRFKELLAQKERLERRKITRRTVVQETGISMTSIQNWANNTMTQYGTEQIVILSNYFGCSIAELLLIEEVNEAPENESPLLVA